MPMNSLTKYIEKNGGKINAEMAMYLGALENIRKVSPEIASNIVRELSDQRTEYLKLIASENFSSIACQSAMGNLLTDKYAEGYPMHRFYAGCDNVDAIEERACHLACKLFGAEHAYVQPHSGADANLCAYWAILSQRVEMPALEAMGVTNVSNMSQEDWTRIRELCHNQRLMGLDYYSGGHLTHGYRQNISAQLFESYSYTVDRETGLIDYDELQRQAEEVRPLILLAGYSAYPRKLDFRRMAEIAHSVGAVFMVDMAHFAGLVAGGVFVDEYNPVLWADVVTTTTHKTLRGPRGGMILCKSEFADAVDKGCPLVIGGPLPHVIAAKAIAFEEALSDKYKDYARRIVENSKAMANAFAEEHIPVATDGTDNHLMLIDVTGFGLNGRQAESILRECGITLNRNALPFDKNGPWYTSGLRIGTPAVTTLGMGQNEMKQIASIIAVVLKNSKPKLLTKGENAGKLSKNKAECHEEVIREANLRVRELLKKFPLYPELDLDFIKEEFL